MCDKCDELDKKIDHYRLILLSIGDQITAERIKVSIGIGMAPLIGIQKGPL
jgi:hypothetical protein